MATMPQQGQQLPDVEFVTEGGEKLSAGDLEGEKTVLYFYPKDDTPGCTIECKEFRDALPMFEGKAHVLGISADDQASHVAFREKFGLTFPLLVDAGGNVAKEFGVWAETPYGPQSKRTTFILRGTTVDRVFEGVKPQGHAAEVLKALG
jgi:thioredoxin-dependent peroxiredoxin